MGRGSTISLGKIFGIPIALDYSWFLIFALLTWALAVGYYPLEFKNWSIALYWIVAAATCIMLFVSVLLHELGHSVVARLYKIPVQSITLFIFGGVSRITKEPANPLSEFVISFAGPLVSFVLGGIFYVITPLFAAVSPLMGLVKYLAFINVALGVFNLIPGYPLDGGGVLMSFIWKATNNMHRATLIAANIGRVVAFLFIGFGVYQALTGNIIDGLWIAFIGWFLLNAAGSQIQQVKVEDLLAGHKVADAMSRNYTTVPGDTTLQQLVDEHILGGGRRSLIIGDNQHVLGILTLHGVKEVPREQWSMRTAAQVAIPLDKMRKIRPDAELWSAMMEMARDGVNQLPVMQDGEIQGMITREDVISYLHTLQEMGSGR
ncbi:MAG: site-2 protease family protein [Anaerolineales bacterium]|jgi:Zn-dependent protease/predicted transcriptional regulator